MAGHDSYKVDMGVRFPPAPPIFSWLSFCLYFLFQFYSFLVFEIRLRIFKSIYGLIVLYYAVPQFCFGKTG